jgi:hypothetical protein
MFSTLDQTLFPTECEVLEIVPHTCYVLPIFKNGSSSLAKENYRKIGFEELKQLEVIDVFVRDPHERFLSGVQTYLTKLPPHADPTTALYFIRQFLYLNRHYCPQVYWLLNLQRFTNAKFHIRPIDQLSSITHYRENQSAADPALKDFFVDTKVKFFNEIDEVLTINLINQTVSMAEILSVIKTNYDDLYDETFGTAQEIMNALHKA